MPSVCVDPVLTRPFAPWNDRHRYTLVPNGGLENGTEGWTLTGQAGTVAGFRPYGTGSRVLILHPGESATSPPVCVGLHYPFFRFFARLDGSRRARLRVEVVYLTASGRKARHETSRLSQRPSAWKPSRRFALPAGLIGRAAKGTLAPVAFRFTAVGANANWQIDDVFVDPYRRG